MATTLIALWGLAKRGISTQWRQTISNYLMPHFSIRFSAMKLETVPFGVLLPLLLDRAKSLYTLFTEVFLKIVRRLSYSKFYGNRSWQYRQISNLIRELTEKDYSGKGLDKSYTYKLADGGSRPAVLRGSYDTVVGAAIKAVAEKAASFGTSLWFTEQDQLDKMLDQLIITGQCTMCYNMINYLESILFQPANGFDTLTPQYQSELTALYDKCVADWNQFKSDPWFVLHLSSNPALDSSRVVG
ncbi:MAG: hypothetical protein DI538_27465 [Azospira oryzae]|nr:MAG: hypothetical protein DI538_27465 [Azospira oryzae]